MTPITIGLIKRMIDDALVAARRSLTTLITVTAPSAHHTTHENGGTDEISVLGLSGLLGDSQTPLAHATQHKSGGPDPIKLDELAAPTDITTLNVSTSVHGLTPKAPNDVTKFLDGTGAWSVPTGDVPGAHAASHASGGSDPVTLSESQVTNLTSDLAGKQPLDTDLTAIAALSSAADKMPFSTGSGTWSLADLTAAARTVLDDTSVAAMLATLGGTTLDACTGRFLGSTMLTSASGTFTTQAATTKIKIRMQGDGGAGGGGATAAVSTGAAPGGNAGAYTEVEDAVSGSTGYDYVVGPGGTPGSAGAAGGAGTGTSFTVGANTWTAPGGAGGGIGTAGTIGAGVLGPAGTAGGVTTLLDAGGAGGGDSIRFTGTAGLSGHGGSSAFGSGGRAKITQANGGAGTGYGSGGSGGLCLNGGAATTGGAGALGFIIVEEYS